MSKKITVKIMTTEIKLIETGNPEAKKYRVTVNGFDQFTPFDDEVKAKAAAFDKALSAQMDGKIHLSYISNLFIKEPTPEPTKPEVKEPIKIMMKSGGSDYPYLRLWCRMMGSFQYYTDLQIEKARKMKAPETTIYFERDVPHIAEDIQNPEVRWFFKNNGLEIPEKK